jgi:hypothetical protein
MYVEVVVEPGTDVVQFWPVPGVDAFVALWTGRRVVVVFTTPSEARTGLEFAKSLAVSPGVRTLLVCPVTPGLFGRLRLARFLGFAKRLTDLARHSNSGRLRLVVWPCSIGHDVVEDFASARSIVLVRTRWWRKWGRSRPKTAALKADSLTLVL